MVKDLVEGDPFPESIVVTGECDVSVPTSLLCEDAGLTSLTPYLVVGGAVVGGVGVLLGRGGGGGGGCTPGSVDGADHLSRKEK